MPVSTSLSIVNNKWVINLGYCIKANERIGDASKKENTFFEEFREASEACMSARQ